MANTASSAGNRNVERSTAKKEAAKKEAAKKPSKERVQRYRDRMRAAGFKPITIWVMDPSQPGFAEEVRRQCELVKDSEDSRRMLDEIEALTDFEDWK